MSAFGSDSLFSAFEADGWSANRSQEIAYTVYIKGTSGNEKVNLTFFQLFAFKSLNCLSYTL